MTASKRDPEDSFFGCGYAFFGIILMVGIWFLNWWLLGPDPRILSEDSAPVGTCIPTKQAWEGTFSVGGRYVTFTAPTLVAVIASVPCDQPHWGEIFGYPILAGPSPYPGADKANVLAASHCGLLFTQRGLDPHRYTYLYRPPVVGQWDGSNWNEGQPGKRGQQNTVACVVVARDQSLLPGQLI